MSRPPGLRKPVRNFDTEYQYAGSGLTPEQAKARQSLRNALRYYAQMNPDEIDISVTPYDPDTDPNLPPPKERL